MTIHSRTRALPEAFEPEYRTRDKVLHGRRFEDLGRPREGSNPRADVHGDATHVSVGEFDLPGVQPSRTSREESLRNVTEAKVNGPDDVFEGREGGGPARGRSQTGTES